MASNVFPMLSSSPPPMDDCPDDDDEDDEFGNFSSAIPFDSSFDSPVALNKIKQFKSCDNGENTSNVSDINKCNSLSNSSSPSQEFISNFPDEKENGRNGFIPIKQSKSNNIVINDSNVKNSKLTNSVDASSHKTPPSQLNSASDLDQVSSEFRKCKSSLNNEDAENGERTKVECFLNEKSDICTTQSKSISYSDTDDDSDVKNKKSNLKNVNKTHVACDSKFIYDDSIKNSVNFEKVCAQTISSESKLDSNFMQQNHEDFCFEEEKSNIMLEKPIYDNSSETKTEFYQSYDEPDKVNLISENDSSDLKSTSEFYKPGDNTNSFVPIQNYKRGKKYASENFCDLSDNEFDDFQSCNDQITSDFTNTTRSTLGIESKEIQNEDVHSSDFQYYDSNDEFSNFQNSTSPKHHSEEFATFHCPLVMQNDTNDFTGFQHLSNSNDDDEFSDFQTPCDLKTESEFADFQCSVESEAFGGGFSGYQGSCTLTEEDEFADFQDFSGAAADNTDEFADFSAVPFESNNVTTEREDDEFADFTKASISSPSEGPFQAFASQKTIDPLSTVINTVFPLTEETNEESISDDLPSQILEQSNKSRRLWEKLHEVEQAPSLRFQWGVSHSFQQLLRSVNVDYHSILRTSSVPIFASGLSLLEPVKGQTNSVNSELEDRNHTPKDPIPPVHFDWNSSGLINPLDSGQTASTLMDLSFLSSVKTNSSATNNDHSFENELLKPSPEFISHETSNKTQILEELLSKNVSSLPNASISHRPSNLSEEAVLVLDQLPDLSFMQAKVLMFPIISNKT